jgi:uncharacterized protein (TIGR02757 family)
MMDDALARGLEAIYERYNRREFVHPDPLEFLYAYDRLEDREIAGLVASGLAYGRVSRILHSVGSVLDVLGPGPSAFLADTPSRRLGELFSGFRHRFTDGGEVSALLSSVSAVQREHGTLGNLVREFSGTCGFQGAMDSLVSILLDGTGRDRNSLLPRPCLGSACKRLNLFARWMVRRDDVDPGGWEGIPPSELLVPLDVHMYRAGTALGFTRRRAADCRTATEITEGFRRICPEDPVKYDFAVTRYGILGLGSERLFRDLFGTS